MGYKSIRLSGFGLQKLKGGAASKVFLTGGIVISHLEEHGLVHVQIGQKVLQVVLDYLYKKVTMPRIGYYFYIFVKKYCYFDQSMPGPPSSKTYDMENKRC